jgi:hypothetical protein
MIEVLTGTYDFDIKAGATYNRFIQVWLPKVDPLDPNEVRIPYPFTGYVGRAQLRKNASAPLSYSFEVTFPADGIIRIYMSDENTSLIPCGNLVTDMKSKYQWALELEDSDGEVTRLLEGNVRVSPELVK